MTYILKRDLDFDMDDAPGVERLHTRCEAYNEYLESISDRVSRSVLAFATASWRHPEDHRALHDSWVESLTISEPSSGDRREVRSLEIRVRLLGAYQDGHTTLRYRDVQSYTLETPPEIKGPPSSVGHGDWLEDEVRLSDKGFVLHEVEFSRGSRWLIECKDIEWAWEPIQRD